MTGTPPKMTRKHLKTGCFLPIFAPVQCSRSITANPTRQDGEFIGLDRVTGFIKIGKHILRSLERTAKSFVRFMFM